MPKANRFFLFVITLTIFFGLLALPGLASEPKAPLLLKYEPQPESLLSASNQITFTPVATLFLPIILRPIGPPNNLKIVVLFFDAQDEYIAITNDGPGSQSLDGWQIESVGGSQTYTFPNGMILGADQSVRVHSGPAPYNNPPGDLVWTTAFVWNNDGGKAELWDNQGALRDSFCYLSGCP